MNEPRFIAHMFGKVGQKSDDVVLGFSLDFVDPFDFPFTALPN
jgi:hypothetical protein